MFEDIDTLEREIETFRNNVMASADLIDGISRLTAETKKQKEAYVTYTNELFAKLKAGLTDIHTDHENALYNLKQSNANMISALQDNIEADEIKKLDAVDKMLADLKAYLNDYTVQADAQVLALNTTCEALTDGLSQASDSFKQTAENSQKELIVENKQNTANIIQNLESGLCKVRNELADVQSGFIEELSQIRDDMKELYEKSEQEENTQVELLAAHGESIAQTCNGGVEKSIAAINTLQSDFMGELSQVIDNMKRMFAKSEQDANSQIELLTKRGESIAQTYDSCMEKSISAFTDLQANLKSVLMDYEVKIENCIVTLQKSTQSVLTCYQDGLDRLVLLNDSKIAKLTANNDALHEKVVASSEALRKQILEDNQNVRSQLLADSQNSVGYFANAADEMKAKLDAYLKDIQVEIDNQNAKVQAFLDGPMVAAQKNMEKQLADNHEAMVAAQADVRAALEKQLAEVQANMEEKLTGFANDNRLLREELKTLVEKLAQMKLDTLSQDVNRAMEKKFYILAGGVGATLLFAFLSIVIAFIK